MVVYADASAVIKRYVEEDHSAAVEALFEQTALLATSMVTRAEVSAALARIHREGREEQARMMEAEQEFGQDWAYFARIPVTEALVARAGMLTWLHGLHGHDAIQLASALAWRDAVGRETVLATFDRALRAGALSAGLQVWPETAPAPAMPWRAAGRDSKTRRRG